MKTKRLYYRVDRRQISMVRFIFEAYEGIAVVTTIDAAIGTIVLSVAPGCSEMVRGIMSDLGKDIRIEPIDDAILTGASGPVFSVKETTPS